MVSRPLLYDGFCGAGGATRGYQMAGFRVVGIDLSPQPRYCGDGFVQMDMFRFFEAVGRGDFEEPAAWACSPPCQGYSVSRNNGSGKGAPRLIPATREALEATGRPYVIENVQGARAEMRSPSLLCGSAFGLTLAGMDLPRHRLFETNWLLLAPPCTHRRGRTLGLYGNGTNRWHRTLLGRNLRRAEGGPAMGIDWMTWPELTQAIPPAYTHHIGAQLRRLI